MALRALHRICNAFACLFMHFKVVTTFERFLTILANNWVRFTRWTARCYILRLRCYILRLKCYILRLKCYILRLKCYIFGLLLTCRRVTQSHVTLQVVRPICRVFAVLTLHEHFESREQHTISGVDINVYMGNDLTRNYLLLMSTEGGGEIF
jgi:hypothetical protein